MSAARFPVVFGRRVVLMQAPRLSTAHPVPDTFLKWGSRKVNLDRLQDGTLERLLPRGYAHATAEQWRPFIERAVLAGLLSQREPVACPR